MRASRARRAREGVHDNDRGIIFLHARPLARLATHFPLLAYKTWKRERNKAPIAQAC